VTACDDPAGNRTNHLQRIQKTLSVRHFVKKSRLAFGQLHALLLRATTRFSICELSMSDTVEGAEFADSMPNASRIFFTRFSEYAVKGIHDCRGLWTAHFSRLLRRHW
jgi:hypothetical protein